jgi:hypothetical protein
MLEHRGPYTINSDGGVDCEIFHPRLNRWIPFSASPDDPEDYGRELYQFIIDNDLIEE